jgi:hypothetical protein
MSNGNQSFTIKDNPSVSVATQASLMEIAIPPHEFLPSLQTLSMDIEATLHKVSLSKLKQVVRDGERNRQVQSLQGYFLTARLLSIGSRIGIWDETIAGIGDGGVGGGIRFYKVLTMKTTHITERSNGQGCRHVPEFGWISSKTKLTLVPRDDSFCVFFNYGAPPLQIHPEGISGLG